jgi:hypothetical protein
MRSIMPSDPQPAGIGAESSHVRISQRRKDLLFRDAALSHPLDRVFIERNFVLAARIFLQNLFNGHLYSTG